MIKIGVILFALLIITNASATEDIEINFIGGPSIYLPGDCVFSINSSKYLCSLEGKYNAYVTFPDISEVRSNYVDGINSEKEEKFLNIDVHNRFNKKTDKHEHFGIEATLVDKRIHFYSVCDRFGRCIEIFTDNSKFIKKIVLQLGTFLPDYYQ